MKDNVAKAQKMLEKHWKEQEVKAKELFELFGKNITKDKVDLLGKVSMDSKVVVSEKEQIDLLRCFKINRINLSRS